MLILPGILTRAVFGAAEVTEDRGALMLVDSYAAASSSSTGMRPVRVASTTTAPGAVAVAVLGADVESRVARSDLLDVRHFVPSRASAPLARAWSNSICRSPGANLVGVRRTVADGAREGVGVVAAFVIGLEIRTRLEYAERPHLLQHAEPLEHGQIHRQQRFADVKTRDDGPSRARSPR